MKTLEKILFGFTRVYITLVFTLLLATLAIVFSPILIWGYFKELRWR